MPDRGLLFITNHENAPILSGELTAAYPVIVSRELADLDIADNALHTFFSTEYIKSPFCERWGTATYPDIESALDLALSSPHTFYILERLRYFNGTLKSDVFRTCFNYLPHLQESLLRAADVLQQADVDYIVYTSTPHDLEAWLFFLVAASHNTPVYVLCQSELPWRLFCRRIEPDSLLGYRTRALFPPRDGIQARLSDGGFSLSDQASNYIARKRRDYSQAEPDYMRRQKVKRKRVLRFSAITRVLARLSQRRVEKNRESASNLDREISKWLTRYRLRKLRSVLTKHAVTTLPQGPAITLFLHFQPERTSVPEGGRFSPQINAIAALRSRMPETWNLIVKEHPSMFLLKSKRPFRHPDFYRIVADMPGTYLVDERVPSFDLIDRSSAVATLTGTVGFEALCRGRPAIVLGDAAYRHYPGVIDLADQGFSSLDLSDHIEIAAMQLKGGGVIERSAAETEAFTLSDGAPAEVASRESMAICALALSESIGAGSQEG